MKALAKPSRPWAVNQLARKEPMQMRALTTAGERLQGSVRTSRRGGPDELQAALHRQRDVVGALVKRAAHPRGGGPGRHRGHAGAGSTNADRRGGRRRRSTARRARKADEGARADRVRRPGRRTERQGPASAAQAPRRRGPQAPARSGEAGCRGFACPSGRAARPRSPRGERGSESGNGAGTADRAAGRGRVRAQSGDQASSMT